MLSAVRYIASSSSSSCFIKAVVRNNKFLTTASSPAAKSNTTLIDRPLKLVECPRDAIQGISKFIPTGMKQRYLNALLKCGFHTIDFGSFVSSGAIPQLRDTEEVLKGLDLSSGTKLLAIIANARGCEKGASFPEVSCLGFPLSVNERFQFNNTRQSVEQAFDTLAQCQTICKKKDKSLVVYLSLAFGNPYGDPINEEIIDKYIQRLDTSLGVEVISIADTIGSSDPEMIKRIFSYVIPRYPHIEFGAHFHSVPATALNKVQAAFDAGVRRIDGALGGMGGCPYAKNTLTGNVATESILSFLDQRKFKHSIQKDALIHAEDIRILLFSVPMRELILATVLGDENQLLRMCRCHFDIADKDGKGALNFEEFKAVMTLVYNELGEEPASDEKLIQQFEKNQKKDLIHFNEYFERAKEGLQKRLLKWRS